MVHYRRIVTHTDFDGMMSAILLRDILKVDEIVFSEPWLIQRGEEEILKGDVIVDLPYDERCALWIDHHQSQEEVAEQVKKEHPDKVIFGLTKSCPTLIYQHFGKEHPFLDEPDIQEKIRAADKIDAAELTMEDINNPDEYGRISISLKSKDSRKDEEFRRFLIDVLSFMPVKKILEQPIVKARVTKKMDEQAEWKKALPKFITEYREQGIVVADLTGYEGDTSGVPRFLIYALYPWAKIAVNMYRIKNDDDRFKVGAGKNIFSEKSNINIATVMKRRGGGGHPDAAGCSVAKEEKEEFLKQLIEELAE